MQLPPDLTRTLQQIETGAAIILERRGDQSVPAVLMKLPRDTRWKGARIGHGDIELHPYDLGPVVRFIYRIYDQQPFPFHRTLDTFLDPTEMRPLTGGRDILRAMARASTKTLYIHAFADDAALTYLGSKRLTWTNAERRGVQAILGATESVVARDWSAALAQCKNEHPISV